MQRICLKVLAVAAAFAAAPAWAVNKCTAEDGKVSYQQQPCAGQGTKISAGPDTRDDPEARVATKSQYEIDMEARDQADQKFKSDRQVWRNGQDEERRQRLNRAVSRCGDRYREEPSIGMSEADFLNCTRFGLAFEATKVNETQALAGTTKQFVYRSAHPIKFVYIRDGLVSAIQR